MKQYAAHTNPVFRALFLERATSKEIEEIDQVFLGGDWQVFGTWARLVLEGRRKSSASQPRSTHGRFWAAFLQRTAPGEQKAILSWLLEAQLAHPGARGERLSPRPLSEPSREFVRSYLSAYQKPARPVGPFGERLVDYGELPDERLIALASSLPPLEALELLRPTILAPRRLYWLHTDYSTRPVEVDQALTQALAAILRASAAVPAQREALKKQLSQLIPALPSGEPARIEEHYDDERRGTRVAVREIAMAPTEDGLLDGLGRAELPSTARLLRSAIAALDQDPAANALFFGPKTKLGPAVRWSVLADRGDFAYADGRIYALLHRMNAGYHRASLWILDAATGQTEVLAPLDVEAGGEGASLDRTSMQVTAAGDLAVAARLSVEGQKKTSNRLFVFRRQDGEVLQSFPIDRDREASLLAVDSDGAVFRAESAWFKQGHNGAKLWEQKLGERTRLERAEHLGKPVYLVNDDAEVSILDLARAPLPGFPRKLDLKTGPINRLLLRPQGLVIVGAAGVATLGLGGELQEIAMDRLDDSAQPHLRGDTLWVSSHQKIHAVDLEKREIRTTPLPSGLREWRPFEGRFLLLLEDGLAWLPLRGGGLQRWSLTITPHMASILDGGPTAPLLLLYEDSQHQLVQFSGGPAKERQP